MDGLVHPSLGTCMKKDFLAEASDISVRHPISEIRRGWGFESALRPRLAHMPALYARYGLLGCLSASGAHLLLLLRLRLLLHLRGELRKKQGKEGTSSNARLTFTTHSGPWFVEV
jgi:hypothetical protein